MILNLKFKKYPFFLFKSMAIIISRFISYTKKIFLVQSVFYVFLAFLEILLFSIQFNFYFIINY